MARRFPAPRPPTIARLAAVLLEPGDGGDARCPETSVAFSLLYILVMDLPRNLPRRGFADAGFTLIEIMIACGVIGVGLVASSYGFTVGIQGVETGRQQSTAVFLAEQRIDQVKSAALQATEPPLANVTAAKFPTEAYGSMAPTDVLGKYRRTVTLTPFAGPAGGLPVGIQGIRVDVNVFYRQITAFGVPTTERSVQLSTFLTSR
jgi:prepilin-type N-terminal cleavage/methylation domain-containing protein